MCKRFKVCESYTKLIRIKLKFNIKYTYQLLRYIYCLRFHIILEMDRYVIIWTSKLVCNCIVYILITKILL